jgi:hypothetical protein
MPNADFSRWPKPEDIARVILFLSSDDAAVIHGVRRRVIEPRGQTTLDILSEIYQATSRLTTGASLIDNSPEPSHGFSQRLPAGIPGNEL